MSRIVLGENPEIGKSGWCADGFALSLTWRKFEVGEKENTCVGQMKVDVLLKGLLEQVEVAESVKMSGVVTSTPQEDRKEKARVARAVQEAFRTGKVSIGKKEVDRPPSIALGHEPKPVGEYKASHVESMINGNQLLREKAARVSLQYALKVLQEHFFHTSLEGFVTWQRLLRIFADYLKAKADIWDCLEIEEGLLVVREGEEES